MGGGHHGSHSSRRLAIRRKVQQRHMRFYRRCSHWSFAEQEPAQPLRWHRERWVLSATVALMVLLSAVAIPSWASAMKRTHAPAPRTTMALDLPALPANATSTAAPPPSWQKVEVQPGQTLSDIFQAQGFGFSELHQALTASDQAKALRNLHPGDSLYFRRGTNGQLQGFRFDASATERVTLDFDGGKATRTVAARELEHRQHVAHGVIHSSLFGSATKAGLSEAMVVKLAEVFKYDIDFIKDIREGDRFTVIYDTVYRDGTYLHSGHILAAEFYNRGKRHTAYRYTMPDGDTGYYTEDGRPLRTSLLRTPVKFTRISSRFTTARKHPVLGYTRAHKGVDYASPKGTPIHAAGSGTITVHGWVRGFGRYIRIKHNGTYATGYAHMSGFAKGLKVGSHVSQGQVIGYVGMTGLATGPHLHYEVRIHGNPVNPLTVTLPKPKPMAPKLLASFKQKTAPMLARMQQVDENIKLARRASADARSDRAG